MGFSRSPYGFARLELFAAASRVVGSAIRVGSVFCRAVVHRAALAPRSSTLGSSDSFRAVVLLSESNTGYSIEASRETMATRAAVGGGAGGGGGGLGAAVRSSLPLQRLGLDGILGEGGPLSESVKLAALRQGLGYRTYILLYLLPCLMYRRSDSSTAHQHTNTCCCLHIITVLSILRISTMYVRLCTLYEHTTAV